MCDAGKSETLFDIGRCYNLSRAALIAANLNADKTLAEGERLIFIAKV